MDKQNWSVIKNDPSLAHLKVPPQSIEAEQTVLGSVIIDPSALDKVQQIIVTDDFYRFEHRTIWSAIMTMMSKSIPVDAVMLSEQLTKANKIDEVGGLAYLLKLAQNTTSANVVAYAEVVRDRSLSRQLLSAVGAISDSVFSGEDKDAMTLTREAEARIFKIGERGTSTNAPKKIQKVLSSVVQGVDERWRNKGGMTGLVTGFKKLDQMTNGLQNGDLFIIAARPSMGKTTFAMNIINHVAIKSQRPVLFFSLEMDANAIGMRSISELSQISQSKLRSGNLDAEDWIRFSSAVSILSDCNLIIDDSSGLSVTDVRAAARRVKRENGDLALIAVDYLQLMKGSGLKSENRTMEITEISRSLKDLAREMNCPLIALSQLNRSLENRPDKRPVMSDLRDSGAIEQDADLIAFIYREEMHNEKTEEKGRAEIILRKHRNGETGTINLMFNGAQSKFID